ncbi:glycosyltransferase, partial [Phocaeicola vulgatus]|uniref:glycosyltransferase n=1 Tax=Phocaeicola vulgatus TaxID=821 RepID=UPI003D7C26C9
MNDEKYIKKQLEFILNQTLPIDEIIICDDRSQDNTIQLIKELKIRQKNHSFSYERSFINRFSTNRKIKKSQYPNSNIV